MALAFIVTVIILPLLVENYAASDAKYGALEQRGLVEVEKQTQPVAPYRPDIRYTVAAHPTALTQGISLAILTGSDSSTVTALVSSDILQGMEVTLYQYADLDAKKQAHAFVIVGELKRETTPYNHLLN